MNNVPPSVAAVDTGPWQDRPAAGAASVSAVAWGAVFAGAVGAASLSLILLLLGSGLGLSSASPWASQGAAASTLGIAGIVWITFTQLAASGMGGYLAGRLRTRWVAVQADEVYFRDTVHGFLAWAVATLVTAAFLTSAIGSVLGAGAKTGAAVAGTAVSAGAAGAAGAAASAAGGASGTASGPSATAGYNYFIDSLFRPADTGSAQPAPAAAATTPAGSDASATPTTSTTDTAAAGSTPAAAPAPATPSPSPRPAAQEPVNAATVTEVGRILVNSLRADALPAEDVRYVGGIVAQRTGLSQQEAEKRVTDVYGKAKAKLQDTERAAREAADTARKAGATASLWLFVSLLVGAFVASFAATWGGRQRDL